MEVLKVAIFKFRQFSNSKRLREDSDDAKKCCATAAVVAMELIAVAKEIIRAVL